MVREGRVKPARRIWTGMGSNTWKSDLKNLDEYVRTRGPADRPGATLVDRFPFMAGIPGTVGGWVKMNAGAFGREIGEFVRRVKVDGRWIGREECGFAYRHSDIEGEIQDVEFTDPPEAMPPPAEFLSKRRKFPAGTWGSVFKNPPGDFAGRLLEEAGAKSLRVGGAYVWSGHANVIVAGEGASASDVIALSRLMKLKVFHRFGIVLTPEVVGL
jgi:UDP-N-acetylmuramate dehydrogenase